MDKPRKRIAAEMSGLGIHYDLGEGHPLLGHRMPDLDLVTPDGAVRVFTFLKNARLLLLNLGAPASFDIAPWSDRIKLVDARYDGPWELPARRKPACRRAALRRERHRRPDRDIRAECQMVST
jgi:3-(3-hydroxy-phenyl)propionate hydroxylase